MSASVCLRSFTDVSLHAKLVLSPYLDTSALGAKVGAVKHDFSSSTCEIGSTAGLLFRISQLMATSLARLPLKVVRAAPG